MVEAIKLDIFINKKYDQRMFSVCVGHYISDVMEYGRWLTYQDGAAYDSVEDDLLQSREAVVYIAVYQAW